MAITINGSSEITSAGVKNYTLSYGSGERVNGIFISTNNRDQKYLANYNRVGDELQLTFPDIDTGFDGVTFTINAYGVDSGGNAIYGSKSVKYYRYNEYGSSGTDYQVFSSGDTVTIGFCGPSDFDVEFTSNLMTITDQTITPNIPRSSAGFYRTATFTILSADKNATYTATVKKNGTTVYTRVFHFNVKYSSNITLTTNWYNGSSISRYNESFGSKLIYDGDSLYIDGRLQTVNLSVNRPSGTSVSSIVVSKDVSWISINRVMSALMVTVNANNTGNTRSGVITVTINNYSMSFTITQSKSGFSVAGDVNPAGGLLLSDATGYSTPTVNAPSSSLPN